MNVFDQTMKEMTPECLASVLVKPVVINGTDLYYMTTSGQLFTFDKEGLQKAVDYQYQILMREIPEDNKEPDNK